MHDNWRHFEDLQSSRMGGDWAARKGVECCVLTNFLSELASMFTRFSSEQRPPLGAQTNRDVEPLQGFTTSLTA
jgi:hypothetical protein